MDALRYLDEADPEGAALEAAEVQQQAEAEAQADAEAEDAEALDDLQPPLQGMRAWPQRSWQLMAYARACKRTRAAEGERRRMAAAAEVLQRKLGLVAALSARLRQDLALAAGRWGALGKVLQRSACLGRLRRGQDTGAGPQERHRYCSVLLRAALERRQQASLARMLFPAEHAPRVLTLSLQWDETSQRMRPARHLLQRLGVALSEGQASNAQCMVFRADLWSDDATTGQAAHCPVLRRCLRLDAQHSNALAEGVLQQLPLALEDADQALRLKAAHAMVLVSIGMDRASANWGVARYLTDLTHRQAMRDRLLVWAEPCNLHGVALVRSRCQCSKRLASALYSLSRWLRLSRNLDAFTRALHETVAARVQVVEEPRPDHLRQQATRVVQALFGEFSSDFLYTTRRRTGLPAKTAFHECLLELARVWDLDSESEAITVWNRVGPNCFEHLEEGRPVGSRLCASREDAVARVCKPLLSLLAGRAWPSATESRWTHFSLVLRKVLLGFVAKRVLPLALQTLGGDCAGASEQALREQLQGNLNDFAAKSSLRLLRIVKTLGDTGLALRLGCMVETGAPTQAFQWALFGNQHRHLSLAELLHPESSPLVAAQARMLHLLGTWSAEGWPLLAALGANFSTADQELRVLARASLLQYCAGFLEHFTLRMSWYPYKAAWLAMPEVTLETKRRIAQNLVQEEACLPCFCKRLLQRYPSQEALLSEEAAAVLTAWAARVPIDIGYCERQHARLRRDLLTDTSAVSFVSGAERLLVRQAVDEHLLLGGRDPAFNRTDVLLPDAPSSAEARDEAAAPPPAKRQRANAWASFRAFRLASELERRAGEQLASEHWKAFEKVLSEEWRQMKASDPQQVELWRARALQQKARSEAASSAAAAPASASASSSVPPAASSGGSAAGARQGGPGEAGQAESEGFQGLFGNTDPNWLLPPEDMRRPEDGSPLSRAKWRAQLQEDEQRLHLRPPFRDRMAEVEGGWGTLQGCKAGPCNACREHAAPDVAADLHRMTQRLNQAVQSLPKGRRVAARELLVMEAPGVQKAALLVRERGRPKMQFWAPCGRGGDPHWPLQEPPFTLRLLVGPSRLVHDASERPEPAAELSVCTSDDLAQALLALCPATSWVLRAASHRLTGETDLLTLCVDSLGDAIPVVDGRPPAPRVASAFPASLLDLEDDGYEAGLASSSGWGAELEAGLPEGEGEGEAAGDDLSGSDAGEFDSESEDEDLARDMMSEDVDLEAAFGRAVVASGQGGAPSEAGDDFGDQYLADALAELERGAEPELGADPEGEEEAEAEQGGGVGALLEAIETDKNGLILCEIAPWQGRTLGRRLTFHHFSHLQSRSSHCAATCTLTAV